MGNVFIKQLDVVNVFIKQLDEGAIIPSYATEGAAAFDLSANGKFSIEPGKTKLIKTGLAIQIPHGYELQIRPRSGLALKNGITVLNTPGTIDSDYRGEIGVILINTGNEPFHVEHGMRIAQAVLTQYSKAEFHVVSKLSETKRGEGGFGSTGYIPYA